MTDTMMIKRHVAGRTFSVQVQAKCDPETGERTVSARSAQSAELAIASALALEGPVTGEAFRYLRGVLGLSAVTLAGLFGVRPETVSRWERDTVPVSRSAWVALGALVLERAGRPPATMARLEHLSLGKPARKRVTIHLAA